MRTVQKRSVHFCKNVTYFSSVVTKTDTDIHIILVNQYVIDDDKFPSI